MPDLRHGGPNRFDVFSLTVDRCSREALTFLTEGNEGEGESWQIYLMTHKIQSIKSGRNSEIWGKATSRETITISQARNQETPRKITPSGMESPTTLFTI